METVIPVIGIVDTVDVLGKTIYSARAETTS